MAAPAILTPCPKCGGWLHGFKTACWAPGCGWVRPADAPAKAAAIPDTRSEEEIRLGIKQALRTLGFDVWDTEQQRADPRVDAGLSDLLVLGHGAIVFAEIKSATGRLRPSQENFARLVRANGGRACLWRSETEALAWATGVMQRTESEERMHG